MRSSLHHGWPHRLARIAAAPSRVLLATPRPVRLGDGSRPAFRHGSLAGVAMPSHRQRYRCASRRADRPSGRRAGTARSRHGDPVGSPVRYASHAGNRPPHGRPAPARLHSGRAVARPARYASAGAARGWVPPSLPARLAGGRGDAVASPTLPLRIAPCRSPQRTSRRHCSLASRRPRRVASSLRLARPYHRQSAHDLAAPSLRSISVLWTDDPGAVRATLTGRGKEALRR